MVILNAFYNHQLFEQGGCKICEDGKTYSSNDLVNMRRDDPWSDKPTNRWIRKTTSREEEDSRIQTLRNKLRTREAQESADLRNDRKRQI